MGARSPQGPPTTTPETPNDLAPGATSTDHPTWTPDHPTTNAAWQAITTNLKTRTWGSRNVAISIATNAGLTPKRATDLIQSATNHGYLQERTTNTNGRPTRQIRLTLKGWCR